MQFRWRSTTLLYISWTLAVTSLAVTTTFAYMGRHAEIELVREIAKRHLLALEGIRAAETVHTLHVVAIAAFVFTLVLTAASFWLDRENLRRRGVLGPAAIYALLGILFIPMIATFVAGDPPAAMKKVLEEERWKTRQRLEERFLARADEILGAWTPTGEKPLGSTTIDRPAVWLDLTSDATQTPTPRCSLLGVGGVPQVIHEKLIPSILIAVTRIEVVSETHYVTHTFSMPFAEPKVDKREPGSVAQVAWHVAVFRWPEGEYLGSERIEGRRPTVNSFSVHAYGLDEGPAQTFLKHHDPSGCVMVGAPALACAEDSLASDDPVFGTVQLNLGSLYEILHDSGRAEQIYTRVLAVQEKALGADDPALIRSLNCLAVLHHLAGRYRQAEPLYSRSIALAERVYGPDHRYVAMLRENFGELQRLAMPDGAAAESERR